MISDTLYAQYIKERQDHRILENEHAFITYQIKDKECFIVDMFVRKEYRRKGAGLSILNELKAIVEGCAVITANIWLWDSNCHGTLQGALACGFKLVGTGDAFIRVVFDLRKEKSNG